MVNTMLVISEEKLDSIMNQLNQLTQSVNKLCQSQELETNNDLVDIKQAARLTGFKTSYIYELKMKGTIPFFKVGKSLRFSKIELQNWIKANRSSILQQGVDAQSANHFINKGS